MQAEAGEPLVFHKGRLGAGREPVAGVTTPPHRLTPCIYTAPFEQESHVRDRNPTDGRHHRPRPRPGPGRRRGTAPAWEECTPRERARALLAIADALQSQADPLVTAARTETGCRRPGCADELTRTSVQLRMFAEELIVGRFFDG
jgi:hypothetical protein